MLQPEYYDTAPTEITKLLLNLENWTTQDQARRIAKTLTITATTDYEMQRLSELRAFDATYKTKLQHLTKLSEAEIDRLFEEAATNAHTYDKRLYDAIGVPFTPYADNKYLQQLTGAIAAQTKQEFKNLSQSMGYVGKQGQPLPPKEFFTQTLDDAVFQVATGVRDYNSVIKDAVGGMARQGLSVVDYASGRIDRAEAAVRRAVLTGVKQIESGVTWRNIDTLGAELVITSAHSGARLDHQPWQGGVFALNGFRI